MLLELCDLIFEPAGADSGAPVANSAANGGVLATAPGTPIASGSDVKSCVACSLLKAVPSGSTILL